MSDFQYSDRGLTLTRTFEGCEMRAYQDSRGVWTVGYGHTGKDVRPGIGVTMAQAVVLLHSDVAAAVACVNGAVTRPINQNQFDALVDFTYNVGRHSFLTSRLLWNVNAGQFDTAATLFGHWVDCDGKVIPGLVRRREAERALFLEAV